MNRIPIYCGNNSLEINVRNGTQRIGTRYRCLKKGFGAGYHKVEPNMKFTLPYEPIQKDNYYCGNQEVLPAGYERFGTLPQCFNKGLGAGMKKRALEFFGDIPNIDTGYRIKSKSFKKRSPSTKRKSFKKRSPSTKRKSSKKRSPSTKRKSSKKRSRRIKKIKKNVK